VNGHLPEFIPPSVVRPPFGHRGESAVDVLSGHPDRVHQEHVHEQRHLRPYVVHDDHAVFGYREVREIGVQMEYGIRGELDEH